MNPSGKALIVIDVQNDYFPGGKLPLWHADETLEHIISVTGHAREQGIPVIFVQHVSTRPPGPGSFFDRDTVGVEIHPEMLKAAPDTPVVIKHHADAFRGTKLKTILDDFNIKEILICGMQTQNCVGLTAISKDTEKYKTAILSDCCTAETKTVHAIALAGFGDLVPVLNSQDIDIGNIGK